MKLLVLSLVLVLLVTGCSTMPVTPTGQTILGAPIREAVYDSCTYIVWYKGMSHKGNCPNPIHRETR